MSGQRMPRRPDFVAKACLIAVVALTVWIFSDWLGGVGS